MSRTKVIRAFITWRRTLYWMVVAKNGYGTTSSPVFRFTPETGTDEPFVRFSLTVEDEAYDFHWQRSSGVVSCELSGDYLYIQTGSGSGLDDPNLDFDVWNHEGTGHYGSNAGDCTTTDEKCFGITWHDPGLWNEAGAYYNTVDSEPCTLDLVEVTNGRVDGTFECVDLIYYLPEYPDLSDSVTHGVLSCTVE